MASAPPFPNGSAQLSPAVPRCGAVESVLGRRASYRRRFFKVLWRKRGINASVCCNLATVAEILDEDATPGASFARELGARCASRVRPGLQVSYRSAAERASAASSLFQAAIWQQYGWSAPRQRRRLRPSAETTPPEHHPLDDVKQALFDHHQPLHSVIGELLDWPIISAAIEVCRTRNCPAVHRVPPQPAAKIGEGVGACVPCS